MFGLENIVQQEEKKLDCQIGNWFDNGKQISIGQWQKIALSRAFLKNASLYILDEPNSALDPISELALWEEYKKIVKYKTGIIVVHKFSNYIKDIDKIVILKNGEIVGQGTHELLLELNDEYKKLYDIQTGLI